MSDCAIIMVTKNRMDLTSKCLNSLFLSDQDSRDYNIVIVDNNSTEENQKELKKLIKSVKAIKNMYMLDADVPISVAFNLGLAMTKDYPYRVKMDNDLLVPGFSRESYHPPQTMNANPGAPAVAKFVTGAAASRFGRSTFYSPRTRHSRFVDHMKNVIKDQKVAISALAPIPPKGILDGALQIAAKANFHDMPYLMGACMMIPKETFDMLGYFDERLTRKIDVEYSQRAMASGLNVGYSSDFGLIHLGENNHADLDLYNEHNAKAITILYCKRTPGYVSTAWNEHAEKIVSASKNTIVNISDVNKIFSTYNGRPIQMKDSIDE